MKKFLKAIKRNTVLKIFAFIIAILLWFYVKIGQNPEIGYDTIEIPVTITGEADINNEGFVITNMPKNLKTNVTISSRQPKIKNIDPSILQATIDVSTAYEIGEQPFTVRVKSDDYEVNVISKTPSNLSLTIDKLLSDVRPVKLSYNGSLGAEYYIDKDNVVITPASAAIKVPSQIDERVSDVLVDIDMTGITADINGDFSGKLIDSKGEEIGSSHAIVVSEDINVKIPILKKKTVPVSLVSTPAEVHFDLSSVQVEIAGREEEIENVDYIEGIIENYSDSEKTYTVKLKLNNLVQVDKQEIKATVVSIGPEADNS